MMFGLSLGMAVIWAWKVARAVASDTAERFWILWTLLALQVSVLAWGLSLFKGLTPLAWGVGQGLCLLTYWGFRRLWPRRREAVQPAGKPGDLDRSAILQPLCTLAGVLAVGILVLSAWERWQRPLDAFDERECHASRVLYWIQHRHIFPYETHNIRQNVFPWGSELFFLWPILWTRDEAVGRMVFWAAYPALAVGLYLLLRELFPSRPAALMGSLTGIATPMVNAHAVTLKPELWHALFVVGTAFWAVRAVRATADARRSLFFAGLSSTLSVHMKTTSLILWVVLGLLALQGSLRPRWRSAIGALLGGMALGVLFSGLWIPLGNNLLHDGHILGPSAFRKVHGSDLSPRQVYIHTVRFVFSMAELPTVPGESVRQALEKLGRHLAATLGADRLLPMETDRGWPGVWRFSVSRYARRYSLGGLAWLVALGWGLGRLTRETFRAVFRGRPISPLSILLLLDIPLTLGVVWRVRWMALSGVPERLLVAPYVLGLAAAVCLAYSLILRIRWLAVPVLALAGWMTAGGLYVQCVRLRDVLRTPVSPAQVDEPFAEVMELLPAGARILLVAHQDARDYPLFAPRSHYANRVVSWGRFSWDPARMERLTHRHGITHILIQDEDYVAFHWDPPIPTRPMVEWLARRPDMVNIPLQTPRMRLFGVLSNLRKPGSVVRGGGCRFAFGPGWHGLEQSGSDWWRWTDGQGQLRVITAADMEVVLRGEMYAVRTPNAVRILADGRHVATVYVAWRGFRAFPPVRVPLHVGVNLLTVVSEWPPLRVPPDPRPLAVAVRNLQMGPLQDGECKPNP